MSADAKGHDESQRSTAIIELHELGFFDLPMNMEVILKLSRGAIRHAIYIKWQLTVAPFVKPGTVMTTAITMGLLTQFDLYGLAEILDEIVRSGARITFARFVESAFQFQSKEGEAYESAVRLGRPNWKTVWNILVSQEWTPSGYSKTTV